MKDEISARHLLTVLNNFACVSGLKLNVSKSQALWLGSKRYCTDKPLNMEWPTKPIKALGVYFSYNDVEAEDIILFLKLSRLRLFLTFGE